MQNLRRVNPIKLGEYAQPTPKADSPIVETSITGVLPKLIICFSLNIKSSNRGK